jgi:hypothetical protein
MGFHAKPASYQRHVDLFDTAEQAANTDFGAFQAVQAESELRIMGVFTQAVKITMFITRDGSTISFLLNGGATIPANTMWEDQVFGVCDTESYKFQIDTNSVIEKFSAAELIP